MNILEFVDLIIDETQIQRGLNGPNKIGLPYGEYVGFTQLLLWSALSIPNNTSVGSTSYRGVKVEFSTSIKSGEVAVSYTINPGDDQNFNFNFFQTVPKGNAKLPIQSSAVFGSNKLAGLTPNGLIPQNTIPNPPRYYITPIPVSLPSPVVNWFNLYSNPSTILAPMEDVAELQNEFDCYHEWKEYVGFTDRFDYCEKCQEKRQA